jgi:acetate kinase
MGNAHYGEPVDLALVVNCGSPSVKYQLLEPIGEASACAVSGRHGIDTSMGLTARQDLVMGARSGNVNPASPAHLQRFAGLRTLAVTRG